jgi:hypothetical protein
LFWIGARRAATESRLTLQAIMPILIRFNESF